MAQQVELQSITSCRQEPAQGKGYGQPNNQRSDRHIAEPRACVQDGNGDRCGQAEHEIAAGQHDPTGWQLTDRHVGVCHRQGKGQGRYRDEGEDKIGGVEAKKPQQEQGQGWLRDNHCDAEQDHDADDDVARPVGDRLGVDHIIRRRAEGEYEADQRNDEIQLQPEKRNESENDGCDDHRKPRTCPRQG